MQWYEYFFNGIKLYIQQVCSDLTFNINYLYFFPFFYTFNIIYYIN